MRFAEPWLLLSLIGGPILLALAWHLWRARRLHLIEVIGSGGGGPWLAGRRPGAAAALILLTAAAALAAVAAARPQWGSDETSLERADFAVVVALDVSLSMGAEDVAPNRFAAAVSEIRRLVDARRGDRIGLVIFAGGAFVRFPLTEDHASALAVLEALRPGEALVPPGSDVSAAIGAAQALLERAAADGAVVIVSDGESHTGDGAQAARAALESEVRVFTVGVGTAQGSTIPLGDGSDQVKIDGRSGAPAISRLESDSLRAIAAAGGGRYLELDGPGAISSLNGDLSALDRARDPVVMRSAPRERLQWFAGAALAALIGATAARVWASSRRAAATGLVIAAALAALVGSSCQTSGAEQANRDGLEHFAAGRYQDALDSWREAQRLAPTEPLLDLNAGRALHALGRYERAETASLAALRSGESSLRATAWYDTGNHRWAAGDLLGAQAAYIEALREQPDLLDAKVNLELVSLLLAPPPSDMVGEDEESGTEEGDQSGEGEGSGEGRAGDPPPDEGRGAADGEGEQEAEPGQADGGEGGRETEQSGSEPASGESGQRTTAEGRPTFEEEAAGLSLESRAEAQSTLDATLEALPLEGASLEQALAVLDALRAVPSDPLAAGRLQLDAVGIEDW